MDLPNAIGIEYTTKGFASPVEFIKEEAKVSLSASSSFPAEHKSA